MRAWGVFGTAVAALWLSFVGSAVAIDVTACEQVVAPNDVGILQADLTCPVNGVFLEPGATLMLNGHELRGGTNIGVYCRRRRCTIEGPGTISSPDWIGVLMEDRVHLTVRQVTFRGNDVGILGTYSGRHRVTLSDVVFEDNLQWALSARTLVATNLIARNNAPGGFYAITAASARIDGGDISSNLAAVALQGGRLRLDGVTVTGNTGMGVDATRSLRLANGTATGNNAGGAGIDIRSASRPRLFTATCGRSSDESGVTWGVCAGD